MANNGALPNLYDLAQLQQPGGGILDMVLSMTEMQDILKDALFYPANDKTSHVYIRNGGLVTGTWVELNDGISASKGAIVPGRAEIGMLESRLVIDERFEDIESNYETFVQRMAYPHYEGLAQQMADAITVGTLAGGYQFNSIEAHIASSSQTDQFGQNMCHTYGGTGSDLSSILAIDWGPDSVYCVYPEGKAFAGVEKVERGRNEQATGKNSSTMYGYICDFKWYSGLVIADDRCLRRICNIETTGSSNNLLDSSTHGYVNPIIDGLISMKNMGRNAKLYMNRTIWSQLWKSAKDRANVNHYVQNPWQSPEYTFDGHLVRFTESLLNTESAVS